MSRYDALPTWAKRAMDHKLAFAAAVGEMEYSYPALLPAWDDQILFTVAVVGDEEILNQTIGGVCYACDPDSFTLVMDVFVAERTAEQAGDLEERLKAGATLEDIAADGGVARGEVGHAMNAIHFKRGDPKGRMAMLPYALLGGGSIAWKDDEFMVLDEIGGFFPNMVGFYMKADAPRMKNDPIVPASVHFFRVSPERARFTMMKACASSLQDQGHWVEVAHPDLDSDWFQARAEEIAKTMKPQAVS